jgi:uncharacterized protein (TIGR03083 family)
MSEPTDHAPMRLDHLPVLGEQMARFVTLLGEADEQQPVPTCPGWTVRDLAVHLGTTHRRAGAVVLSGSLVDAPEPLVLGSLTDWYAGCASALVLALQAVDPAEPVPNWAQVHRTAGFWRRRQLHETLVHAVDLAVALGLPEESWPGAPGWAPDADVAADGVDELLTVAFRVRALRGSPARLDAPVRVETTDTDDAWVVAPGDVPVLLAPGAAHAGVVRGTAADLYLALWGRVDAGRLDVEGDAAAALLAGPLGL